MLSAIIAFFIIVVPSIAGSLSFIVAESTTSAPVVLLRHRLTQSDIDLIIDVEAPRYGLDSNLVKRISLCEDQGNPYAVRKNKTADGVVWSEDSGPLQINDFYHGKEMVALAEDIHDPVESLTYGMALMKREGTQPWLWSKGCWNK